MAGSLTQDLVSVVIATYNMGRFLPQAVPSALAQTYTNSKFRSSTMARPTIPPRSCSSGGRIRACACTGRSTAGRRAPRTRALPSAAGRFVAFLDADDFWLPEKLARQMPLFQGRPEVGVVYSDYRAHGR